MKSRDLLCKNDLIDSVKSYGSLDLKVFYNLLYLYKEHILYKDPEDDDPEISMYRSQIIKYIGSKNLSRLELADVIVNIPKGIYSSDKSTYVSVFEYILYDMETEEFTYKISESFKPYIDDVIQNFTVLELEDMSKLNSIYSLRMFEFISKNKNLKTYLMPIGEFKDYFQIPKSYQMCVITSRILEYGADEINKHTDFTVSIDKVKQGNKVSHIRFNMGVKLKGE